MAASNEWTEWHLTATGWVEGSQQRDFAQFQERPIPPDRVVTVTYKEVCNGYGPIKESQQENWRSELAGDVQALLARFGPAPKSL